jgi:AmmeMemoRadiSam system protein A
LQAEVITHDDQQRLLTLARRALEARIHRTASPEPELGGAMELQRGAFVTIRCGGELRGCLGRLQSEWTLARVVVHLSAIVGDSDRRFEPVTARDLPELTLEISVLTPEREIHAVDEIEIGRHGLAIEQGSRRGLLLPHVAVEHGWDRQRLVEQACAKAGVAPDAWHRDARMFVFEAQTFGEARG